MQLDLDAIETTGAALRAAAQICPDQTALSCGGTTPTYAQLDRAADHLAHMIKQLCTQDPERIGFLGHNSAEFVGLMFGTMRAGATWTPLNWRLTLDTLIELVAEAGIRHLFADEHMWAQAEKIQARTGLTLHNCTNLMGPQGPTAAAARLPLEEPEPNRVALQIYTSGTSGLPKGVMLSHRALLASRKSERAVPHEWSQWAPGEINLVCMPNFHVAGVLSIFGGICNLGQTILLPQFEPGAVLDVLSETPPARLLLVPSAIKLLLDEPKSHDVDFSRIRYVFYGGSPMPKQLMREILARLDCEFVQFYGMTETSGRATYLPPERHKDGPGQKLECAGRPFPGVDIEIRDPEGKALPCGENGEICLRSPGQMEGYFGRAAETAKALDNGWYRTGDVGHLDSDGELHVVDRLNDKIVTGGENVYPSEVESVLLAHPAVEEVAVFGRPDPKWIESVNAAVVLAPGHSPDATSLIAWSRERIGAMKSPKQVIFLNALPRSATGKVLRKQLAESSSE